MKKILVRTGLSPLEETPVSEILTNNLIGNNVGNIVYAYSIYRGLMTTPNVELVPTRYQVRRLDPDRINDEYDSFVIPLADYIRRDRVDEIKAMTSLINALKIPCTIIGIGVRAKYDYEKKGILFEEDKVAYDFFKAVLNKSALIGVRGEMTGDYLKKLGFIPEKDYTVIGCPSFYTYGENLKLKESIFDKNSKMAFNNTVMTGEKVQSFLQRECERIEDSYYYPQKVEELKTLYLGVPYRFKKKSKGYPNTINGYVYKQDKVRFHTHYHSWKNELSERDFSIGPRLHGNVMAMLSGIPTIWIAHDGRMRELVEYHNLPYIHSSDVDENTDVLKLFSKIDYKSILKGHKERFRHYVDFLDKNGIPHIFQDYKSPEIAPLDIKLEELGFTCKDFSVKSVLKCDVSEISKRIDEYDISFINRRKTDLEVEQNIKQALRDEIKDLKEQKRESEKNIQKLENKLRKTEIELEEAKKKFIYLVRRKIKKIIGFTKKEEKKL